MDMKQNPFSFYDFFGYLFPGAFLIYMAIATQAHVNHQNLFDSINKETEAFQFTGFVPLIIIAYVFGHLVSFSSALFVERYFLWKYGYPSKSLLGLKSKDYYDTDRRGKLGRGIIKLILLPISLPDFLFAKTTGIAQMYTSPLDDLLKKIIAYKIQCLISNEGKMKGHSNHITPLEIDFFRFVYHYVVERCPAHLITIKNYVALYGLHRTLALIFTILFWSLVLHLFFSWNSEHAWKICGMLICCSLFAYAFFLAFMKFYRRFSLETLMAMAANYDSCDCVDFSKLKFGTAKSGPNQTNEP